MTVSVKLFATLTKYLPPDAVKKTAVLEFGDQATTNDIIRILGIPDGHIHLILINGKHAEKGAPLIDGATVSFFPPVAGG
ncbi:MAG: MoaD/ThiS family protein [candidate division Zixibacteria bacterium]|nr:MoaD/ThiS family protein [candidate division Zixibacteria bacterium]